MDKNIFLNFISQKNILCDYWYNGKLICTNMRKCYENEDVNAAIFFYNKTKLRVVALYSPLVSYYDGSRIVISDGVLKWKLFLYVE